MTQAYLVEGRNRVRVHEPDGSPPTGFVPVAPTLEDAYLVLMRTPASRLVDGAVAGQPRRVCR